LPREWLFRRTRDFAEEAMNQPEGRFIFDWRKSPWDYRLPVLIAISFFAHLFCFYIFRVVYPMTTSLLPPSAQVTVLDPNRPQDKSLLDWVAVNDPAKISAPGFDSKVIAEVAPRYKPTYSTLSVELKGSESARPQELGVPSLFSAETLFPMRSQPQEGEAPKPFRSRLEIASTLQSRNPISLPAIPSSSALAEPTSIFVGVSPEGEADYVFLTQSSGTGALDQKALDFIRTVKFKPGPNRDWGMVTLHWGGTQS
jgi:TonB family protein